MEMIRKNGTRIVVVKDLVAGWRSSRPGDVSGRQMTIVSPWLKVQSPDGAQAVLMTSRAAR